MRYRELTRRLRALDCEFDRQAKGDHEIWINISTHAKTTIPIGALKTLDLAQFPLSSVI